MKNTDRPVLIVAERLDHTADMVVDQLNELDVPVLRCDVEDFPQRITLVAEHGASTPGWRGLLDDGHRSTPLENVRAIYYRRPGRPEIAEDVPEPYATWARNQAEAALLNVLAALPVRWINNPHADRLAAHKPQQLVIAAQAGLRVPRSIITNDPDAARAFTKEVAGPIICKPVLGGRLETDRGRLMVPTHVVDPAEFDGSLRLTAHYFQEAIRKVHEVRLIVVARRLFAATLSATSDQARTDWRTDYDAIIYGTTQIPESVTAGVHRFMTAYGQTFGAFDFAVTPEGEWVFFENNPAGTWSWVEHRSGLPIAAAHAEYLRGEDA